MAWKFLNACDARAARKQQSVLQKIDRWWREFQSRTRDLDDLFHRRKEWDLPGWMEQHLQEIDAHLMWEFGSENGGGHRLIITPEAEKHLRPLVQTILERAPALPGWRFYPYRQPEPLADALATVEARTDEDFAGARVYARIGEEHCIDLLFQAPAYDSPDDENGLHAAFVTAESLLGEEILDKWVGSIELTPDAAGKRFLPLERLKGTVGALVASIREQLPDRPYHQFPDDVSWSLLKVLPEEQADYPVQQDLFVAVTMAPELWQAAHLSRGFYSERFSRCGERFAYLKIDGNEGLDEAKFADREEIETAVNAVLKPAQAGCVIGGGTGLRYSYIDLALTDVPRAAELLRQVLREGNLPRRSWLLFFDCEWQREWIGIWDDTPKPPR